MSSFDWKKKHQRLYQIWTDHNHQGRWNIFWAKGGKRKTNKGISRCHGYTKTYPLDLWRCAGERLCNLQRMDQRVIQQKFYNPYRVIKLLF